MTGDELSGNDHVLKQSAFLALNQLAIVREQSKGARLGLQCDNARGKLANVVPSLAHVLLVAFRLPRYGAGDSATCIPLLVSAGSNTMRTRACKTPATRRSMLREWPS